MGKGELAIRIAKFFKNSLEWNLKQIVIESPEPEWTQSLGDWATANDVPVHQGEIISISDRYDMGFSCFYGRILKPAEIAKFQIALNLHNGPLPRYRGVNPINWALKNSEKTHGVTIHQISPGVDDGDIFGQVVFDINPSLDEVIDVYKRCLRYGFVLFEDTISRIDSIIPIKQDPKLALTYTKKDFENLGDRSGFTRSAF